MKSGWEAKMRLIDADELKEDFKARLEKAKNWKENALNNSDDELVIRATATIDFICEVIMTINNAPTVEERPQGEWIMDNEHTKNPLLWYKCNLCGVYHSPTNFCPNCGADMRGGTE